MTEFIDRADGEPTAAELARMSELVSELQDLDAERARLEGRRVRVLDEVMRIALGQMDRAGGSAYEFPVRSAAAELAAAVKESPRSMQGQVDAAHDLARRFPATLDELEAGGVSVKQARVIQGAGSRLEDDGDRRAYEAETLVAGRELAPGRLRKVADRIAERLDPQTMAERHALAREARRVVVTDTADGMSELFAVLPAVVAHGIHDRLTAMADAVRRDRRAIRREAGGAAAREQDATGDDRDRSTSDVRAAASDERTLDQLRADLLGDLLLTGAPGGHHLHANGNDHTALGAIRATVQVTIPVTTLAGLDDDAGFLDDGGAVDPGTARALAARAPGWERIFLHPSTGTLLVVDGYVPTVAQRRFLRARDATCRFPGRAAPGRRSDVDHTIAYSEGGSTTITDLAHLCEPHHMVKHQTRWQVRQRDTGILEWTSPTGIHYIDAPLRVHFTASAGPPPF